MSDRVLIIGSESDWGQELVPVFYNAGFKTARATIRTGAPPKLEMLEPDMVILDEGVTDSMDVCFRYATQGVPVILVGDDPSQEIWRVALEEAGAEFYLRNPIDHDVLIARVRAILRRYKKRRVNSETLYGG
jgi:two-component system, OmpR family, response regulator